MHWVLGVCCLLTFALFFPKMDIITPGEGILAKAPGSVVSVDDREMVVKQSKTGKLDTYRLSGVEPETTSLKGASAADHKFTLIPHTHSWQTWAGKTESGELSNNVRPFQPGDKVGMRELLARGSTHIYFQANVYVFTMLVLLLGLSMGIGMAAVYKHIPTYFPDDVGVVGGLVGVIGGLGGFVFPIVFGWLLTSTGIWTTCWMLLFVVSVVCLVWMRLVLRKAMAQHAPELLEHFDRHAPEWAGEMLTVGHGTCGPAA
jgi:NNP family nitrate/nitrite transporter-like MFS transporter